MYFDTAYLAKFYLNEPDSSAVRQLAARAESLQSSLWAWTEFHAVLHRRTREGVLEATAARDIAVRFSAHVAQGLWILAPVSESLLRRTGAQLLSLPPGVFIRAGDALHLATAADLGEAEVWTNDRHMLAAAPYFGITGRSA